MDDQEKNTIEHLEDIYTGERMMDYVYGIVRMARAIAAFKADQEMAEDEIFTEHLIEANNG